MTRECGICGRKPEILIEVDKKFYCTDHAVVGGYVVDQNIMRMKKIPVFGKPPGTEIL